jgi:polyvinyl alcohol dehydrogenase (cytochrome)
MRRLILAAGLFFTTVLVASGVRLSLTPTLLAQQPAGAAVYKDFCASCHDTPEGRTPDLASLRTRTPEAVLAALETGAMMVQASKLTPAQRRAVSEFVAARPFAAPAAGAAAASPAGMCTTQPATLPDPASMPRWNGWGYDITNSRYQPAPGFTAADVPNLKLKWAFGFPAGTPAYSQPTVASGRIYVGSGTGVVFSLDSATGCTYWTFKAASGVRATISIGPLGGGRFAAYFGDLQANVYAVDARTGELIWQKKADDHRLARVTGAPTLHDGRLYVPVSSVEEASAAQPTYPCCTFRGSVIAYNAITGEQLWKSYTIPEAPKEVGKNSVGTPMFKPAGAAVWNSPTIDVQRGALYVGTGNAYTQPAAVQSDAVMAFDLKTGAIRWTNQVTPEDAFVMNCRQGVENCPGNVGPDFDFGNAPILRQLPGGRSIIAIGQKSGLAYGLDPDKQGAKVWEYRAGAGTALGGLEWGSAADEVNAYFPVSDVLMPAPQSGGLHAVALATGQRVWHTPHPPLACTTGRGCTGAQSAPASVMPGVVFSGSMDGNMRAYSTTDGKILWTFNTMTDFQTVNGVPAKGGSIDAAGPVIADGMMITTSGYALFRGTPGNVMLVFSAK